MSTCATLLLLFALPFKVLNAQEDRGTIAGTVTDPGGAIVPNALVTAVQNETNVKYKTTSNDSGEFTIPSLPVGNYRQSSQPHALRHSQHQFELDQLRPGDSAGEHAAQSPVGNEADLVGHR